MLSEESDRFDLKFKQFLTLKSSFEPTYYAILLCVKCKITWHLMMTWDYDHLRQRFSNFFQVGTTFISQNVLRTTLLLGLSNSLGLP